MVLALAARRAVSSIGRRLMDVSHQVWSEATIIETLDDVLEPMWTSFVEASRDHWLGQVLIPTSSFQATGETNVMEAALPEWAGAIRKVEGSNGTLLRPYDVDQVDLERQHHYRGVFDRGLPVWVRGVDGVLRIIGKVEGFNEFRVWYVRRWPPMHYGAAIQSGGGSTTQFIFDNAPATLEGRVVARDDLYIGMQVEFSSGNTDHLSYISDYDGATQTATLETAAGANIVNGDLYSLVLPVPPQHSEYVKEKALHALLEAFGQDAHIAVLQPRLDRLEERFYSGIRQRDNARPPVIWSRRR